jgi:oligopeptide transport system substrate-binding protein
MKHIALSLAFTLVLAVSACTRTAKEPANTIHIPSIAKIKTMDPANADDMYSGFEVGKVYDNLVHYAYLKRPFVLEAQLAEAMPKLSSDKKTYTFKLKKGVLFQDDACFPGGHGREMTADDVVYSLKRLADPKNTSSGWWTLDDKVVGLNEWRDESTKTGNSDYSKEIPGLKALDRYTVQITLKRPNYQFLYALAMPFTGIVPREAVEKYGKDFANHPVGTGPFKLTEMSELRLIWDRNPTYRTEYYPSEGEPGDKEAGLLADAGKTLPRADRIVTEVHEESQPMWLKFMSGALDLAGIPKDNFGSVITSDNQLVPELKSKGMRLNMVPMLDLTHTSFNMEDPIVGQNKLLRQAISLADNQAKVDELFYNNQALAAQGPIPPGLNGYDEKFVNPYRQYNVAKAKELLAKAGYPNGEGLPVLEYVVLADSTSRQMSEFFEKELKELGIHLKTTEGSWPQFDAAVKGKKGQMWSLAWGADYPDAEDFLALFYSKNVSPGSNDANYQNPEFDKLYEKSLTLPDSPERTALYKQMAQIVVDDCVWIWGANRKSVVVLQPWMRNYKYGDVFHDQFQYYAVDPSLRKK